MKQRELVILAMSVMTRRVWLGSAAQSENLLLRLHNSIFSLDCCARSRAPRDTE